MEANFIFPNVKAFDISKSDVLLGETFRVELNEAVPYELVWRSSNDPVLAITVEQESVSATIEATSVGESEIWLTSGDNILKKLYISVYSTEAATLNIKVGKPEKK